MQSITQNITLKEMIAKMDSGAVFGISFVTCDQHKGTGGELITVDRARKHNWLSTSERKRLEKSQPKSKGLIKNPRHYENSTRNIMIMKNGDIRKVHLRLIRKFNGKVVL